MKVKTADLIGPALDWAVAKCEGRREPELLNNFAIAWYTWPNTHYSTNWSQGGMIIEREEIGLKRNAPCSRGREWEASPSITAKGAGGKWGYGPTPLVAAMRCFVASELGDKIEIPEELLK